MKAQVRIKNVDNTTLNGNVYLGGSFVEIHLDNDSFKLCYGLMSAGVTEIVDKLNDGWAIYIPFDKIVYIRKID